KGLHSKLYAFDSRCAIISSANFTAGGFFNNYELGVKTLDEKTVEQTIVYFDQLFNTDSENLVVETVEKWELQIRNDKPKYIPNDDLPDFGNSPFTKSNNKITYFIKFFGRSDF